MDEPRGCSLSSREARRGPRAPELRGSCMIDSVTRKASVIIVTGFLGAGKTTLINRILTADHGRKIAVIVNEFGEVGIDHHLLLTSDHEVVQMNNGCVCCTVQGGLLLSLFQLLE